MLIVNPYICLYYDDTLVSHQGLSSHNNIHVKSESRVRKKPKNGKVKIRGDTNQSPKSRRAEEYVVNISDYSKNEEESSVVDD